MAVLIPAQRTGPARGRGGVAGGASAHLEEFDGAIQLTVIGIGQTAELNVFQIEGNTQADRQAPMFGRGRIDHLGLQAASLAAFGQIRDRLLIMP